jgi:hypothetical protein
MVAVYRRFGRIHCIRRQGRRVCSSFIALFNPTQKMEAICSCETSVEVYQTTRRQGQTFCLHCVQTGSGAQPQPLRLVPAFLSPEVKRPGRESNHSPSSSAETKNPWSCTSPSQYVFKTLNLIKHRDNFIYVPRRGPTPTQGCRASKEEHIMYCYKRCNIKIQN